MKKVFILFATITIISCHKDDGPPMIEEMLTGPTKGWLYDSFMVYEPDQNGTPYLKEYIGDPVYGVLFGDCRLDDTFSFAADGTYTFTNNTKCDDDESAILDQGRWRLSDDKKTLYELSSSTDDDFVIIDITPTSLTLEGLFSKTFSAQVRFKPKQ